MTEFLKKNLTIIILFLITLFAGFFTFLTFIDKSFDNTDTFFPIDLIQIKKDFKCIESDHSGDLQFTKWIRK